MRSPWPWFAASCALVGLLGGPVVAADFPPITDQERALTAVPGEPNAPAVLLFKNAELQLAATYGRLQQVSSSLRVTARTKILTEQGKSRGEVSIPHSRLLRLKGFQGRTVLPDGRVLPLSADARFERKISKRQKRSVTSVAFPGVEVGAILDYQYELLFDSYFLEPWYFSDELPVLFSEVVFKIPSVFQMKAWTRDPFRAGLHNESKKTPDGTDLRVWAENLPSVPDEPYGLPFEDLATQMRLLPVAFRVDASSTPILEKWEDVAEIAGERYRLAQRDPADSTAKAREILKRAGGGARQQAEALYRFVRDEVATADGNEIWPGTGSAVEDVFSDAKGTCVEKALLLQTMLEAARIESCLVWAADRWHGQVDLTLANPAWFDRVLVAAEIDGQRVFLDPSDRALGFGQIPYAYEGTAAVLYDRKKPEPIVLPETPFDRNGRRAVIDLTLDEAGAFSGTGELVLTGAHAWERIDWQDDDARTLEAWKKWLDDEYDGFAVSDVKFEERPDDRTVRLTWKLAQREEDVLGDETSLVPSRPLGPVAQPLVQAGDKRRSQVLFAYADRDEVELRLHWPAGWRVDTLPGLTKQERPVGAFVVEVEEKEAERSLVYRRRFDLRRRLLITPQEYEAVRALYAAVEKSDAQPLALVRR